MQKCKDVGQPIAALLADLKARGLLDERLVVWSGEFGRTPMQENRQGLTLRLGFDDKRRTYPFRGLHQRLGNVTKPSAVVHHVIA